MIKSIFGLNTEDLRKREAVENQELAEMLSKSTGNNYGVTAFGTAFGREAGKGLLSKMGYEDPEMAKAEANEAKQKQLDEDLSGFAVEDPKRLKVLAEAHQAGGNMEEAVRYANMYRKVLDDKRKEIKSDYFRTGTKVDPLTGEPKNTDKQRFNLLKALHPNEKLKDLEEYVNSLKKEEEEEANSNEPVNNLPEGFNVEE